MLYKLYYDELTVLLSVFFKQVAERHKGGPDQVCARVGVVEGNKMQVIERTPCCEIPGERRHLVSSQTVSTGRSTKTITGTEKRPFKRIRLKRSINGNRNKGIKISSS